ncbi:MAG: PQQ-binding-like beta-propeller repeat protein [Planctomycetales bacterium]|nr:PQQ-binding-like beta-propeller repeat protein [Planctomycetales bacterium]
MQSASTVWQRKIWPLLALAPWLRLVPVACAGDWPRFRGPTADGHAPAAKLPLRWSEQQGVMWKVAVPGQGHSSPVITAGQLWLTTALTTPLADEERLRLLGEVSNPQELNLVGSLSLHALCFDVNSGQLVHDVEVFAPAKPEPIHYTNTYASPTPVLHQGRVYVHFGTYGTACIEAATGQILWKNNELHVDHQNGPGSSPIVWDELLIIHYDGTDEQYLVALHLADGRIAWKTHRSGELHPRPEMQKAYCTPVVVHTARGPELISPGANWVYGYDPQTGSELWKASYGALGFSTVPCPVVGHGMAYVCTSFGKSQLLAVRVGGVGDVTHSHIAWTSSSQIPKQPSLLLHGRELYVCNDTGIVTCLDALTGKEVWRARIGGNYCASPLLANGLIYFFSREGKTTVLRSGRRYDEVSVNVLDEGCHASPAVWGDALFLRTDQWLYRIQ